MHEFGWNLKDALKKSNSYHFCYAECMNSAELNKAIAMVRPDVVVYNFYSATMPWLTKETVARYEMPQIGYVHEFDHQNFSAKVYEGFFDYYIFPDPTIDISGYDNCFKTGRLLSNFLNYKNLPQTPVIGSFGFGFEDKGFGRLITKVQEEFDEAIIRINMPFNDVVDPDGKKMVLPTAERCRQLVTKPGIKLEITHEYFSKKNVLEFLSSNSINAFLYNVDKDQGLSSVLDYALSVQRPVAISSAGMFRHVPAC
jgi:hypothetical protein